MYFMADKKRHTESTTDKYNDTNTGAEINGQSDIQMNDRYL